MFETQLKSYQIGLNAVNVIKYIYREQCIGQNLKTTMHGFNY